MRRRIVKTACIRAVGVILALPVGCTSADMCDPGDACAGARFGGYVHVLNAACQDACSQAVECGDRILGHSDAECEAGCLEEATRTDYWTCEPPFREYLNCVAKNDECEEACAEERILLIACRGEVRPSNADSCKLANNGVCDEPDGCVEGSDTSDCR